MSTTGLRWGCVLALTLATTIVGGTEAEGSYYRETAPLDWQNTNANQRAPGRGLEMRVNERFTASAIDVWANTSTSTGWETQMKIFQLGEPGALPGTLVAHNEEIHATDNTWDWISFDFDYTFERETSYVLYWYGLGDKLPFEAGTWSTPLSHSEFSVERGVAGGIPNDGTPTENNLMTPLFRLAIEPHAVVPEPSVAMMALAMGGLVVLRRRSR